MTTGRYNPIRRSRVVQTADVCRRSRCFRAGISSGISSSVANYLRINQELSHRGTLRRARKPPRADWLQPAQSQRLGSEFVFRARSG